MRRRRLWSVQIQQHSNMLEVWSTVQTAHMSNVNMTYEGKRDYALLGEVPLVHKELQVRLVVIVDRDQSTQIVLSLL